MGKIPGPFRTLGTYKISRFILEKTYIHGKDLHTFLRLGISCRIQISIQKDTFVFEFLEKRSLFFSKKYHFLGSNLDCKITNIITMGSFLPIEINNFKMNSRSINISSGSFLFVHPEYTGIHTKYQID